MSNVTVGLDTAKSIFHIVEKKQHWASVLVNPIRTLF